jgi:anion-transporting  ArsA/GET3 family ATPase
MSLSSLLEEKRVVICAGSGGVGKTTTAAALAIQGASLGRKTLVLTIDPARRLADALGIAPLEHNPRRVPEAALRAAGRAVRGTLDAMMLDAKAALDDLVHRHAPSARVRDAILANPIYRYGSRALIENPDYLAMETVQRLEAEKNWDLLVVDTPPTRHALDFFSAARRMVEFLERNRFLALMTPRGRRSIAGERILGMGVGMLTKVLARVTGSQLLDAARDFFTAFEEMFDGFRARAARMDGLLRSDATSAVIVTTPEPHALAEARLLYAAFAAERIPFGAFIVNRVAADALPETTLRAWAAGGRVSAEVLARSLPGLKAHERERASALLDNYLLYRTLAERDRNALLELADLGISPKRLHIVPILEEEVARIEGLRRFLRCLKRATGSSPFAHTLGEAKGMQRGRSRTDG